MIGIYKTEYGVMHALEKPEDGTWIQLTSPTLDECREVAAEFEIDILDLRTALDDEESARVSIEEPEDGTWIQLTSPTLDECREVAAEFEIDILDLRTALDDEESARVSIEDGYTLILVDIPSREVRHGREAYTTIPLGIILTESVIITVCAEENAVLDYFTDHRLKDFSTKKRMRFVYQLLYRCCMYYQSYLRVINRRRTNAVLDYFTDHRLKDFSTKKRMRFVYQLLYRCCMYYQSYLRVINRRRTEIEASIHKNTEDSDLIDLHELESNLVYFATSLRKNGSCFKQTDEV